MEKKIGNPGGGNYPWIQFPEKTDTKMEDGLDKKTVGDGWDQYRKDSQFVQLLTGFGAGFGWTYFTLMPDGKTDVNGNLVMNNDHSGLHRIGQTPIGDTKVTWGLKRGDDGTLTQTWNVPDLGGIAGALSLLPLDWGFSVWRNAGNKIKEYEGRHKSRMEIQHHLGGAILFERAYAEYALAQQSEDRPKAALALEVMQSTYKSFLEYSDLNKDIMTRRGLARAQRYLGGFSSVTAMLFGTGKVVQFSGFPVQSIAGFLNSSVNSANSGISIHVAKETRKEAKNLIRQTDTALYHTKQAIANSQFNSDGKYSGEEVKEPLLTLYDSLGTHIKELQGRVVRETRRTEVHKGIDIGTSMGAGIAGILSIFPPMGLVAGVTALGLGTAAYANAVIQLQKKEQLVHKHLQEDSVHLKEIQQDEFEQDFKMDVILAKNNMFAAFRLLMLELGHTDPARQKVARTFLEQLGISPQSAMALQIEMTACRDQGLDDKNVAEGMARLISMMGKGARIELARGRGIDVKDKSAEHILSMLRRDSEKNTDKRKFAIALLKDYGATDDEIQVWSKKPKNLDDQLHINHTVANLLFRGTTGKDGACPVMPPTPEFILEKLINGDGREKRYAKDSLIGMLVRSRVSEKEAKAMVGRWLQENGNAFEIRGFGQSIEEAIDKKAITDFLEIERARVRSEANLDWREIMHVVEEGSAEDIVHVLSGLNKFINSLKKSPSEEESEYSITSSTDEENLIEVDIDTDLDKLQASLADILRSAKRGERIFTNGQIEGLRSHMISVMGRLHLDRNPLPSRLIDLLGSQHKSERTIAQNKIRELIVQRRKEETHLNENEIDEKIASWKNDFRYEEKDKQRAVQELEVVLGLRGENDFTVLHSSAWVMGNLRSGDVNRVLEFKNSDSVLRDFPDWVIDDDNTNEETVTNNLKKRELQLQIINDFDGQEFLAYLSKTETSDFAMEALCALVPEERRNEVLARINGIKDMFDMVLRMAPDLRTANSRWVAQTVEILIGIRKEYTVAPTSTFVEKLLCNDYHFIFVRDYIQNVYKSQGEDVEQNQINDMRNDLNSEDEARIRIARLDIGKLFDTEHSRLAMRYRYDAEGLFERLGGGDDFMFSPSDIKAAESILKECGATQAEIEIWGRTSKSGVPRDKKFCIDQIRIKLGLQAIAKKVPTVSLMLDCLMSDEDEVRDVATNALISLGVSGSRVDKWCKWLRDPKIEKRNETIENIKAFVDLKRLELSKKNPGGSRVMKGLKDLARYRGDTIGDKVIEALKNGTVDSAVRIFTRTLGLDVEAAKKLVKNLKAQIQEFEELQTNSPYEFTEEEKKSDKIWFSDYIEFQLGLKGSRECYRPSVRLMKVLVTQLKDRLEVGDQVEEGKLYGQFAAHFGVEDAFRQEWARRILNVGPNRDLFIPDDDSRKEFIESYLHQIKPKHISVPGKKLRRVFGLEDTTHINGIIHALGGESSGRTRIDTEVAKLVLEQYGVTKKDIKKWARTLQEGTQLEKELVWAEIYRSIDQDYFENTMRETTSESAYRGLQMLIRHHAPDEKFEIPEESATSQEVVEHAKSIGLKLGPQDRLSREFIAYFVHQSGHAKALEDILTGCGAVAVFASGKALGGGEDRWVLVERCTEDDDETLTFHIRDSNDPDGEVRTINENELPTMWKVDGGMLFTLSDDVNLNLGGNFFDSDDTHSSDVQSTSGDSIQGNKRGAKKTKDEISNIGVSNMQLENHIRQEQASQQCGYACAGILTRIRLGKDQVPDIYLDGKPKGQNVAEINLEELKGELQNLGVIPVSINNPYNNLDGGHNKTGAISLLKDLVDKYGAVAIFEAPTNVRGKVYQGDGNVLLGAHWIVIAGYGTDNESDGTWFAVHDPVTEKPVWQHESTVLRKWYLQQGVVTIVGTEQDRGDLREKMISGQCPEDEANKYILDAFSDVGEKHERNKDVTRDDIETARKQVGNYLYQHRAGNEDWNSNVLFRNVFTEKGLPIDPKQLYDKLSNKFDGNQLVGLLRDIYAGTDPRLAIDAKLRILGLLKDEPERTPKPIIDLNDMLLAVGTLSPDDWMNSMKTLLTSGGYSEQMSNDFLNLLTTENIGGWKQLLNDQTRNLINDLEVRDISQDFENGLNKLVNDFNLKSSEYSVPQIAIVEAININYIDESIVSETVFQEGDINGKVNRLLSKGLPVYEIMQSMTMVDQLIFVGISLDGAEDLIKRYQSGDLNVSSELLRYFEECTQKLVDLKNSIR